MQLYQDSCENLVRFLRIKGQIRSYNFMINILRNILRFSQETWHNCGKLRIFKERCFKNLPQNFLKMISLNIGRIYLTLGIIMLTST